MFETYGEDVEFLVVYIREAHAIDSPMPLGGKGNPLVQDPVTLEERMGVAQVCSQTLDMSPMPMLIDDMEDSVGLAYSAWPERLYLVDDKGKIAYAGGKGPRDFVPDELEDSIRVMLELEPIVREKRSNERRRRGNTGG